MNVNLSDDNMKDIIAKAVLDTLTPESRSELISNAIKSLLVKPTGNSYNSKTPMQDAFDCAVRDVARAVAQEQIVGDPEIKAKITSLIADAWVNLTNAERYSKLVENVTSAIERGLTGDRY
ncbi:hypothetical protein SPHV1_1750001 [Novosphingobium sp. KN65.2]|nr:hypothetical protein SPHV1_1750001 [Novosphingobium sp. KN65.2]